jgi:hypothetical protein
MTWRAGRAPAAYSARDSLGMVKPRRAARLPTSHAAAVCPLDQRHLPVERLDRAASPARPDVIEQRVTITCRPEAIVILQTR